MIAITEHAPIPPYELQGIDTDALRHSINYDTHKFVSGNINLMRYEFDPEKDFDGFRAYFRIGAEWLDNQQSKALVVTPKDPRIDFLEMFMTCLRTSLPDDNFSQIYDIDFDAKPIKSPALNAILTPLLVVQFLNCVERLASRSLRKGYVARHENLAKVKGRIDLMGNERYNMLTGHRERMLCKFDEFSADTTENRFIKHGLRIARNMIAMMEDHRAYPVLAAKCNRCLTAFSNVSDARTLRLPAIKHNKLFRDYSEALRLASMLMRRRDISVSEHGHADEDYVPVFRIDMSLLFEHYTLALLREKFGSGVFYQAKGKAGIADFLLNSPAETAVLDSKYTFKNNDNDKVDQQYIKQLSGYARDKRMLKRLGIDTSDEDKIPIVKCIILYPETREKGASFSYDLKAVANIVKFFKCPVPLPVQNLQTTPTPT